jgi:hypothetical protein
MIDQLRKHRRKVVFVASSLLLQGALPPGAQAAGIDENLPYHLRGSGPADILHGRQARPIELKKRAPTLDEMIRKLPLATQIVQPIPVNGLQISGLTKSSVDTLGWNYFVVVNNSHYERMSDIYRDSRINGKSNFVTADSIIHPYTAFSNRILADVAVKQLAPDILLLLNSMMKVSLSDYEQTQDADVREDIERNIAYLALGIKLLNPQFEIPAVGKVVQMTTADLKAVNEGKLAESAIFQREEDFGAMQPYGWYGSSEELSNFFRCREWLTQMAYPITDTSGDEVQRRANNFRRSVLLFRSLEQATALGKPATEVWQRITKAHNLYGSPTEDWKERTLYVPDYKSVFKDNQTDLKETLNALSEPFYRTKLMLAIRRQKPVNLGNASIFEIEEEGGSGSAPATFRLFAPIGEPELPWMRLAANLYPYDKQAASSWPIALLDMYVWGAPQAGNILADNLHGLDPEIAKGLPHLQRCVLRRLPTGMMQPMESRRWSILSPLFRNVHETAPAVLRTDVYLTRRLESAFAGWVDHLCAIAPPLEPSANEAATPDAPANTAATAEGISAAPATPNAVSQPPRRLSRIAPYHYLDPVPDVYKRLNADAKKLIADLTEVGYFKESYRQRFDDFMRLFQRLEKIADAELRNQPLQLVDKKLLANIDIILDKVDQPLAQVLTVCAPSKPAAPAKVIKANLQKPAVPAKSAVASKAVPGKNAPTKIAAKPQTEPVDEVKEPPKGFNLATGRPGMLYVIIQNPATREWTLARGALYSYYEMPAPMLTASMWKHKIDSGFYHPPGWTEKFDVMQQLAVKREPKKLADR